MAAYRLAKRGIGASAPPTVADGAKCCIISTMLPVEDSEQVGRLELGEPTDLPQRTEVPLVVADGCNNAAEEDRPMLDLESAASIAEREALDAEDVRAIWAL
jgi:hypothetical protein